MRAALLALVAVVLSACAGPLPDGTSAGASPVPTAVTRRALAPALTPSELKLRLLSKYPDFFYCDPDFYPVARGDETDLALARWDEMQRSVEAFTAIVHARNLEGTTAFSNEQKLAVYRDFKRLSAIVLQPDGEAFKYSIRVAPQGGRQGSAAEGTISANGTVTETMRQPTIATCPICLPRGVLIDTPLGQVAIERVTRGTVIWTRDLAGARVPALVTTVTRTSVPPDHQVVRVSLADGRSVTASPGHRTAAGVPLADLRPGDALDASIVVRVERIPYEDGYTFDILPAGETGIYWADGVPLSSTLR